MVSAYLLIKTETGNTKQVYNEIAGMLKTKHKNMVFGAYDIVIKLRTRTNDDLIAITKKIKSNPNVKAILVLQCWEEEKSEVEPE